MSPFLFRRRRSADEQPVEEAGVESVAPPDVAPADAPASEAAPVDSTPPPSVMDAGTPDEEPPSTPSEEPIDASDSGEARVLGRMARLRGRLSGGLGRGVLGILGGASLTEADWEDAEALLLQADLGLDATQRILGSLRRAVRGHGDVRSALRALLLDELRTEAALDLDLTGEPSVIMVVGVNGTGKTTTCGKLATALHSMHLAVVLGAADTFRAAAAEQLATWGSRAGVPVVRGPERADPASVAYEAVQRGTADGADVVIIDTAGRLHTKVGLMDELGKVRRVVEKVRPVREVLLVLDATTGQNGLVQARVFGEAVAVTGVVLTKLDGTAKGGIVFAVQRELGVPVKFVGLGEGADDLAPFDPEVFVDALLG